MTEVIQMKADDARVGRYSADGAPLWPQVDCDGEPFNKKSASTRSLKDTAGERCFVVIAPNRDHDELVFEIVAVPAPAVEPAPAEEVADPSAAAVQATIETNVEPVDTTKPARGGKKS